jgi:zinc/manganese transport system substrate-binding protein/manganese/iron transport system substrate-binding protein
MAMRLRDVARFVAGGIVGALALGSLAGCSTTDLSAFRVVTTTTQVSDFTQHVLGESGLAYPLLQANQSAHTFDPSARDLLELRGADALVVNGQGLEPWAADAIAAAGFVGTIIVASDPVDPETRDGVIDPHVWTDPANAAKMTQFISQRLGTLNPKDADVYTRNANAYELQLEILDGWILETFDLVPAEERLLVTNHDAFTYFVSAYDITLVGSIIPEFDDNAEPSAADIDALIAKISQTGVRAIFAESSISPKLAETIAAEAGIRVFAGDDSLYSDTLGAPGSGSESYISATIHNVKLLAQSWGVVVPPVPKEIANA